MHYVLCSIGVRLKHSFGSSRCPGSFRPTDPFSFAMATGELVLTLNTESFLSVCGFICIVVLDKNEMFSASLFGLEALLLQD